MSTPELVPRSPVGGLLTVWVASVVIAIAVGIFSPLDQRGIYLCVGLGVCVALAFFVQIRYGRAQGFITRVSASLVGAVVLMAIISAGFSLATISI